MAFLFFTNKASELGGQAVKAVTTNARDANYAGEEIEFIGVNGTNADIQVSPQTDIWLHCRVYCPLTMNATSLSDGFWLAFFDNNNNRVAYLDLRNGTQYPYVTTSAGDNSGTPFNISDEVQYTLDVHVVIDATNITATFYVDGVLAGTAAQVAKGTTSTIDLVKLEHWDMAQNNSLSIFYSEIIVADEDTRGMRLATLNPDGNGGVNDWEGGFANVLEKDSAGVVSDTAGEFQTFTLSAYNGEASPAAVRAVAVKSTGRVGTTGPQNAKHVLRIGTTNYEGAQFAPSNEEEVTIWETNPATAGAWSTSDFASLEAGIKSEA